ncbi:MAG: chorismate-binding protein, partial [Muribaculaceae bacterium]|nr:chorismate-binding protein [Muribaculaceae bacterium]
LYTLDISPLSNVYEDLYLSFLSFFFFSFPFPSFAFPTPALCGSPLEDALRDIRDFELHTRDCYGGFVGIHDARRGFRSFVNLRSARIIPSPQGYFEILAGGGLLNGSDPASEWAETESKASRLLSILSKED